METAQREPKHFVEVEGIRRERNRVAQLKQVRGLIISKGCVEMASGQVITRLGFMKEVGEVVFFVEV